MYLTCVIWHCPINRVGVAYCCRPCLHAVDSEQPKCYNCSLLFLCSARHQASSRYLLLQSSQLKRKVQNGCINRKAFGWVGKHVVPERLFPSKRKRQNGFDISTRIWGFSRGMSLSSCSRKCTASPLPRMVGLLSVCFCLWSNMHDSSPSKPGQCVSEECWQECTIARSRGNTHPHGLRLTVLLLSSSYKDMRLLHSMNS